MADKKKDDASEPSEGGDETEHTAADGGETTEATSQAEESTTEASTAQGDDTADASGNSAIPRKKKRSKKDDDSEIDFEIDVEKHSWRFEVKQISFLNKLDEKFSCFLKFHVGPKKNPLKSFRTRNYKNLGPDETATFENAKYQLNFPETIGALRKQYLQVELWVVKGFNRSLKKGEWDIPLSTLANGSIQQEATLIAYGTNDEVPVLVGSAKFLAYFQEQFDFKVQFHNWQGNNLRPNDDGGTSDPRIEFAIRKSSGKSFFQGGFFGPNCRSEPQMNTLFPFWEECGNFLYSGIRSELEDEMLDIRVYDWDPRTTDDLIGFASVPMRGVIEYGSITTSLGMEETVEVQQYGKTHKVHTVTKAGSVEGEVRVEALPRTQQFGDLVLPKPGQQYLAVKVIEAKGLPRMDEDGLCDGFVSVEWDGVRQETKVIEQSLNPKWHETLYFSLVANTISKAELSKRGNIKITVLDFDEAGNDAVGFAEIELYRITHSQIGEEGKVKAKMLRETVTLSNGTSDIDSTLSLKVWFQPDLPEDLIMERESAAPKMRNLSDDYLEREKEWRKAIPFHLLAAGTYPVSAMDEQMWCHFLPTYLSRIPPPRGIQDAKMVSRIIQCFTFTADKDNFEGREDVWTSPNFFLDVKKGDAEDHAILQANLFLGLNFDVYVCFGTTHSGSKDHVWLLTREADGNVKMWETTNGKVYTLPKRWRGPAGDMEPLELSEQDETSSEEEAEQEGNKSLKDRLFGGKKAPVEKKKKKKRKKKEAVLEESSLVYHDGDLMYGEDGDIIESSQPVVDKTATAKDGAAAGPGNADGEEQDDWFEKNEEEGQDQEEEDAIQEMALPYKTIEVVFNHENVWGNIQKTPDPALILYDIEDMSKWMPFISFYDGFFPETPQPFYTHRKIQPALPPSRVESIRNSILQHIKEEYKKWRADHDMETIFVDQLVPLLEDGLSLMEDQKCTEDSLKLRMDAWKGRLVSKTPAGYEFEGVPINFLYLDRKKISEYVMQQYHFHEEKNTNARFSVAVHVRAYPAAVCSVWIYLAILLPKM